jgi:deazaflavin-dependent oxidoreductase (nitroreductase family)
MIERISPIMNSPEPRHPPRWLKVANRVNIAMLTRGIGPATQRVLTIPGRTSGLPRRTPIATVAFQGAVYLVAGYSSSDWVKNARAAGSGTLSRGGHSATVTLVEIPVEQRAPILREFLHTIRGGRSFLTVGSQATDAEMASAANVHPVFRVGGTYPTQK